MKPNIALDTDDVLLDYHQEYAYAWATAFGTALAVRDPIAYWPIERWAHSRHADLAGFATWRRKR